MKSSVSNTSKLLSVMISFALILMIVTNIPRDPTVHAQDNGETNTLNDNSSYINEVEDENAEVQPAFLPALPVALIALEEALIALGGLIGATALATFVNYAIKHGMSEACKKFSPKNKHIKTFCENNNFPTK